MVTTLDSPIRLLLVTHSLSGGGAERFASALATNLDSALFTVAIATAIDRVSYSVPPETTLFALGFRGLASLPRTIGKLAAVIDEWRPDLVLSNVLSTNCLVGAALRRSSHQPPWVARVGNAPELSEPRLQRWWARKSYPRAALLVSNSERMRDAVAAHYPALAERCVSLATPTDFARIDRLAGEEATVRRPLEGATALWVGRLSRQKRPELALAAVAQARKRVDLRLRICGEGALRGKVEREIGRLGLTGVVELLGFCDNPFALMAQADYILMTSDYEGLPNALIEAQGLGLPAVSTACPYGPDEIVAQGETGILVAPGDGTAAGEALARLTEDPPLTAKMGVAARRRARRLFALERLLPLWQARLLAAAGRG